MIRVIASRIHLLDASATTLRVVYAYVGDVPEKENANYVVASFFLENVKLQFSSNNLATKNQ